MIIQLLKKNVQKIQTSEIDGVYYNAEFHFLNYRW